MSVKPRVVFDASAVVSALLFEDSLPGQAFYGAIDYGEIILSGDVIEEFPS